MIVKIKITDFVSLNGRRKYGQTKIAVRGRAPALPVCINVKKIMYIMEF